MMLFTLIRVEMLKLRRSLALLMLLVCPLLVVLLNTGMLLKGGMLHKSGTWQGFWLGNLALWCYFMLPLYIALVTALLNGQEHKSHAWRLMLTLPLLPGQLYLAKALLAWGFVLGANACLLLLCHAVLWLIATLVPGLPPLPDFPAALSLFKVAIACLPVVVIQHAVSWRFANVVAPLALGVGATMGIIQLGSSSYWVYFPWSYALMAANGGSAALQTQALLLAAVVGVVAYLASAFWLGRRELAAA